MKRRTFFLRSLILSVSLLASYYQISVNASLLSNRETNQYSETVENDYVITFSPNYSPSNTDKISIVTSAGPIQLSILRRSAFNERRFVISAKDITFDQIVKLRQSTDISSVEKNIKFSLFEVGQLTPRIPNDPRFSEQHAHQATHNPEAWPTITDTNVIFVDIDSGVDLNHQDLQANLWVNPFEIPDNGIDDDNNGVIDDVHGYNAILQNGQPNDDNGHGTHVAGIGLGVGNNERGITGVAWHGKILIVKCFDKNGSAPLDKLLDGFDYIQKVKAQFPEYRFVLNASWGTSQDSSLRDAVANMIANDIVFVAAAGNGQFGQGYNIDLLPVYPASYDGVVTVAALDGDQLTVFSNFGKNSVEIATPGLSILSTFPGSLNDPDGYTLLSGTSMAAPQVTGALILILGDRSQSVSSAISRLLSSVDKLGSLTDIISSGGRMNLAKAVEGLQQRPNNTPVAHLQLSRVVIKSGESVVVDAKDSFDTDQDRLIFRFTIRDLIRNKLSVIITPVSSINKAFTLAGNYQVELTVNDYVLDSKTVSQSLVVEEANLNQAPIADAHGNYFGEPDRPIVLHLEGRDPDGDPIRKFDVDFGDGTFFSGSQSPKEHTYQNVGIFDLRLIVYDQEFSSQPATAKVFVEVKNQAPVAILKIPERARETEEVELDASQSFDADGEEITLFIFEIEPGVFIKTDQPKIRYHYALGEHQISLIVRNSLDSEPASTKKLIITDDLVLIKASYSNGHIVITATTSSFTRQPPASAHINHRQR